MPCKLFAIVIFVCIFSACKTPSGIFTKKTAHEQYGDKLNTAGLKQTALGGKWFDAAGKAITNPVAVQLPYKESGYFAPDRPTAIGLRFNAKRGEQLTIELTKTTTINYLVFADLFSFNNGAMKYIQSIDTISNLIRYIVRQDESLILRIQPELLQSGSYTVSIKTGPSLAFPVQNPNSKNRIISFWGAGRDRGLRKHEGVDIGGALGTPLVAVGNGYVSSVTENNLGGKVVFIRSAEGNETWYYAHLDSQIAKTGRTVKTGDVIGLMGNTGNAKTTAPHLHFGIYTTGGAIDPLAFINPAQKEPAPVTAATNLLGKQMRISGTSAQLHMSPDLTEKSVASDNLPVIITGATKNLYKVVLPMGEIRFVSGANVKPMEKRIKQVTVKNEVALTDAPVPGAPVIKNLYAGAVADLLGVYGQFQYVSSEGTTGWIFQ